MELRGGLTFANSQSSLGNGKIIINGGVVINNGGSPVYANDFELLSTSASGHGLCVGFGSACTMTSNGTISGPGNLVLNSGESNGGSIVINGNNTYQGTTEIYGTHASVVPTYTVGSDTAFSTGQVNFHESATFCLNATSGDRTISNPINVSDGKTVTVTKIGENDALLSGTYSGTGSLVMSAGTALEGSGSLNSLTLKDGSEMRVNLDDWITGTPGALTVNNLTFEGDANIVLSTENIHQLSGKTITFLNSGMTDEQLFALLDFTNAGGSGLWFHGAEGNAHWLSLDQNAVPEPAAWLMLLAGLGFFCVRVRTLVKK